ncbi:unnamed protein product [Staurois parvus]|uniref:Fibronectin type-III domain-containing protein n=1 Tax=Staurois parvus TaxID=386267 RepID=A0ABN9BNF7_9NEOB|nr:unnamed protein product [Staurois parvus]
MLRYVFGLSLWIVLCFIKDVEPVKCTINITESKSSAQYLYVKWSSPGITCNFSLTCSSSNFWQTTCNPIQKNNDTYECTQLGLEAGTVYDITIEAQQDGETKNFTNKQTLFLHQNLR